MQHIMFLKNKRKPVNVIISGFYCISLTSEKINAHFWSYNWKKNETKNKIMWQGHIFERTFEIGENSI